MTAERKVLVVDRAALRILSATATMTEVTEAGVTVVEDVRISRKALPFPAVYLLLPTPEVSARTLAVVTAESDVHTRIYRQRDGAIEGARNRATSTREAAR